MSVTNSINSIVIDIPDILCVCVWPSYVRYAIDHHIKLYMSKTKAINMKKCVLIDKRMKGVFSSALETSSS